MAPYEFVSVSTRVLTRVRAGFIAAVIMIAALGAPLGADKPPQYFVDETKLPFDALPGTTTTRLWGVQGGAGYRIEVPLNWNGELVLYAHGYRGTGTVVFVDNPSLRAHYVARGFAWAASSYQTNGYDVSQGVRDSHALIDVFRDATGERARKARARSR